MVVDPLSYSDYPQVSIIVLNYNGRDYLRNCLRSIQQLTYPFIEVIVVDNGSTDGSVDLVKREAPFAILLINERNLGFSGGNNRGIKVAKGKYILLVNNDVILTPESVSELVKVMEQDPSIGMAASKSLLMDNPRIVERVCSFLTPIGLLHHFGMFTEDKGFDQVIEVFSPIAASLMLRKDVIESVGGFDEEFFLYFEESDLAWRFWLSGYRVVFVPQSIVLHKHGGSLGKASMAFKHYHSFKNRIRGLLKNLELKYLLLIVPLHIIICLAIAILFTVYRDPRTSLAILKAIFWNVSHLKDTIRERQRVQKLRKLRDEELFRKFMLKGIDVRFFLKLFKHIRESK
jgi:GT2 family glycosyltransferase